MSGVPSWGEGVVIAGRYRLVQRFGQGGMGSVWRADHVTLRSPVAVKLLDPSIADSPEMLERFMREAQSAAALRSTHVVQIFDYGVEQGIPYIAMELLQGESLQDRLDRVQVLSRAQTGRVVLHVARAIGKAHEVGIIHRDLKPDNVFIVMEEEEVVKVLDFGIAKVTETATAGAVSSNTKTGAVLGTPYYMSPEQARGNRTVDHRSDLWSLAVITYECLTGRRPFHSDALGDLLLKICTEDPVPASQIVQASRELDAWFRRALNRDPAQRFQSARELSEALHRALQLTGEAEVSLPVPLPHSAPETAPSPAFRFTTGRSTASAVSLQDTREQRPRKSKWLIPALAGAALLASGVVFAALQLSGGGEASSAEGEHSASPGPQENEAPKPAPAPPVPEPAAEKEPEPTPEAKPRASAEPPKPAVTQPPPAAKPAPPPPKPVWKPASKPAPKPAEAPKPPPPKPATVSKPSGSDLFSDRK